MKRPQDTYFGYTNQWRRKLHTDEAQINSSLPSSRNMFLRSGDIPNPGIGTSGLGALGVLNDITRKMLSYKELDIKSQINDYSSQTYRQLNEGQAVQLSLDINRAPGQLYHPGDADVVPRGIRLSRNEQEFRPADSMSIDDMELRSRPELYDVDGSPFPAVYETIIVEVRKPKFDESEQCTIPKVEQAQKMTTKFHISLTGSGSEVRSFIINEDQLRGGEVSADPPIPLDQRIRAEEYQSNGRAKW